MNLHCMHCSVEGLRAERRETLETTSGPRRRPSTTSFNPMVSQMKTGLATTRRPLRTLSAPPVAVDGRLRGNDGTMGNSAERRSAQILAPT